VPTLPVTPTELAIALVLATIGSVIQGAVGFGLAVISAPILLLMDSETLFVPGPLLIAACLLTMLIALRDRSSVAWREVSIATVGRVLGTVPGAYAVGALAPQYYNLLFAVLILSGIGISVSGWHLRPTGGNLLSAAILSGFTSTVSSVGGPPLALVYQHAEAPQIRGTLSVIFTIGTIISVAGLAVEQKFGMREVTVGLALAPAVIVGFVLSGYVMRYIDGPRTRTAILAVSALSAVLIIVRVIW
jgi:uncharacterized membrane protein YfcA